MNTHSSNKRSSSALAILLILVLTVLLTPFFVHWGNAHHPFVNDVNQYYSYLNALFIEHDLGFTTNANSYWLMETPTHHVVPKVTYGMAFFYAPFYLLAKLFAPTSSTGYEAVYAWFIHYGCIGYIMAGLWFTRKTLLHYFNEFVTSVSLVLLFFGTNLFYYTLSESESVHGVLFFLISVFLYNVIKWYTTYSPKRFLIVCLAAGFICVIRPTECLVLLFPMLIGVCKAGDFKLKLQAITALKWHLLAGMLIFMLPLLPQLVYWKMQSGTYLFFSYGSSEGFFWSDPQIINVFFGFRKGFFIYTPVMLFSIIGFFFLYKKNRPLFYPTLFYFLMNSYLICTWWDWSFGGSFGMRAFIHCFAILVIPFAYFISEVIGIYKRSAIKTTVVYLTAALSVFFCLLNVFQSNLYKHQIIHYDGMNKKAYEFTFLKKRYTKEELDYLTSIFKSPDYEARRRGFRDQ